MKSQMITDDLLESSSLQERIETVVKYSSSGLTIVEISKILAENSNQVKTICQLLIKQGRLTYDSNSYKIKHTSYRPPQTKMLNNSNKFLNLRGKELLPGCPSHWSLRQCFKHLGYQHQLLEKLPVTKSLNSQKHLN